MQLDVFMRRFLLGLALLAVPGMLGAQESMPDTTAGALAGVAKAQAEAPLLDAPVDANRYVLGPGDRLNISVFGALSRVFPVDVSPSGELVIPGIGVVDVGGVTLAEAESRVRRAVLGLYQNVGVHLTLASVRQFKVFVIGNVPAPGVRVASAASRVSEVVPLPPVDVESDYIDRNIIVRRGGTDSMSVDLVRFRLAGALGANPWLREGDVVVVPVVNERVYVFGRVSYPGAFEFRKGETLAELLTVANGGGGLAPDAADTIRVSRNLGPQRQEQFAFTREQGLGAQGRNFVLQPSDAVYVPRDNSVDLPLMATIQGEVVRPGAYPIRPGVTTVRDLVGLAGGFQADASLAEATLQRATASLDTSRLSGLRSVPQTLLSSRERRLLAASAQAPAQNVIIDFQELFLRGAEAYNQIVETGDVLTIPKRHDDITVLGAVAKPGLVHYEPGQRIPYFIALAGGYSRKADRGSTTVIHANSPARFDADEVKNLLPGDLVIVPYEDRRDYLQLLQTTSAVVTTITGLVLTFVALVR
jgi:protein involved in polysaccharide export with SLBB domain